MKVVVYFRRSVSPSQAAADLTSQRAAATAWMKDHGGLIVAEFTELETGSRRRPVFGAARRSALAHQATLLVVTTKPIAPGPRFSPLGSGAPPVVCLPDPEEQAQSAWAQSRAVVLYLRALTTDTPASTLSLAQQRQAIARKIWSGLHDSIAEFIEREDGAPAGTPHQMAASSTEARPALHAALAIFRENRARLVIGTTDTIDGGVPFQPDFMDVPFTVAYQRDNEPPAMLTIAGSPSPLGLLFNPHRSWRYRLVYLVNCTGGDLTDIVVRSTGRALISGHLAQTSTSVKTLGDVPNRTGRLLEVYDLLFDGDFVIDWQLTAIQADTQFIAATATAMKGEPERGYVC